MEKAMSPKYNMHSGGGVGRSRSTNEVPEQGRKTVGGAHGGKAANQGEHWADDRAPNAEPDRRVAK